MQLEDFRPNEYFKCKRPCGNVTHSTLPRTKREQAEDIECTKCGRLIQFSTISLPVTLRYPRSMRTWGTATELTSPVLRGLLKAKYLAPYRVKKTNG